MYLPRGTELERLALLAATEPEGTLARAGDTLRALMGISSSDSGSSDADGRKPAFTNTPRM